MCWINELRNASVERTIKHRFYPLPKIAHSQEMDGLLNEALEIVNQALDLSTYTTIRRTDLSQQGYHASEYFVDHFISQQHY